MEFLNKIEIIGIVGSVYILKDNEDPVANISVVTESSHRIADGTTVVDYTWFNVNLWQHQTKDPLTDYKKGDWVHVIGRLKMNKYFGEGGAERLVPTIVVNTCEKLNKEL